MRGTPWNKEVDGKDLVCAVQNFRMIAEWTARNCTGADRYHDGRLRQRLVSLFESQAYVLSDGAGNQKSVRVSRRCYKLNTEAAEIEYYRIQNINVRLASIASARADLSEFERAPKDAVGLCSKAPGKAQVIAFGQDQIVSLAGRELVLLGQVDRSFRTGIGTLRAEQTATKIESQTFVRDDRVGRAGICASCATRRTPGLVPKIEGKA
jgi:hypothetical protein